MAESTTPSSIKFFYEKGKLFRVVHVDGAIGGLTPTRNVFLSIYNERSALPQIIQQNVTPEGILGQVVEITGKQGIFREMEIGLVMSAEVADQIAQFLQLHARAAKQTLPPQSADLERIQ